jgi:pre-mRNA-splicing factor 18
LFDPTATEYPVQNHLEGIIRPALLAVMDFLKAEIASKKRTLSPSEGSSSSQPAPKYMRKGDLERIRKEQEEREAEAKRQEEKEKRRTKEAKIFAGAKKVCLALIARLASISADRIDVTFKGGESSR